ncbi:MAG: sodium/glutamate symporter [Acidobacteriota bacterium]|nr:sodium/glutamate symporter [Blastocatellia bacterium]MDW8241192.1 sodium/glutamate symporter [Acidobacteriota bacterium]
MNALPIHIKMDVIQTLALAAVVLMVGISLKRRLSWLDRLNIPAAVIGGLLCSIVFLTLRDRVVNVEMDLTLRDLLMIAFFTTVGLNASLQLIKRGGWQVLVFFGLASLLAVVQNLVGIALARLFHLHPLLGIIAGSVSLTGGPATSLAFGPTFEQLGISGATTLGLASATFGITSGGLLGGPLGTRLVERYRLLKHSPRMHAPSAVPAPPIAPEVSSVDNGSIYEEGAEKSDVLRSLMIVAIAMGIGSIIGKWISAKGIVLPAYIGAMIVAALFRNLDDRFKFIHLSPANAEAIGNISLSLFISMALMNLKLWELVNLALPLLVILLAQVLITVAVAYVVSFHLMGRDYESAVMASGFLGFMLGTAANAIACMDALVEKFGAAPRAYLVVSIVGAFLIDFTNALIITTMANLFK